MKYLCFLSNPLASRSEWVYELFSRIASRLFSLARSNARQWVAQLLETVERGGLRSLFDRSCNHCLLSNTGMHMPAGNNSVNDLRGRKSEDTFLLKQSEPMPMVNMGDGSSVATTVCVSDLLQELELNPPKNLSPVRRRQRDKAIALVRDEALLQAAYSFNSLRLEGVVGEHRLLVGGETLPTPERLPTKGELSALGCCACTLGPRLETRVSQLFAEKRAAQALALDFVGNELLSVLGRRLQDDILASVRRQGLSLGQALAVGESALDLSAQAAVLRLAGAAEIGISLHRGNLLLPQKSTSVVFAVGRNLPKASRANSPLCPALMKHPDGLPG